ncbi:MAG: GGDEF domain-containing phosphodiesterase, partial [Oceanospirillum sp.]|nr:GGDEF domain-containing phosphodiesterase [Oceanospirillum sp.]
VGVTIFPDDGEELTRVLQNADQAMYAAKSAGRHTYRFFTPVMQQEAERRQLLQNDMRSALENHEFELHYQPVVDQTGRAVKVEALVRWNHPEQGRVPPDQFIPLAEETGLIVPLGGWVFNQAVSEISRLRKQYPDLGVAINLSSKQIGTDDPHVEHFIDIVQQYDLPSGFVTLEVTESLFLDPGGDSVEKLNLLREQGFEIAIDDFGTGYSSLSYLKQLPLTTIKIDKSFVSDLDKDDGDKVLVDAILSIAQSMQLSVIAEGVETEAQSEYLVSGGAQMQQGWLHGKPMPYDQLCLWIKENHR